MIKRVILLLGLLVLVSTPASAGRPFSQLRSIARPLIKLRSSRAMPRQTLPPAEKMRELYGPSILVREPVAKKPQSRFVTQPE